MVEWFDLSNVPKQSRGLNWSRWVWADRSLTHFPFSKVVAVHWSVETDLLQISKEPHLEAGLKRVLIKEMAAYTPTLLGPDCSGFVQTKCRGVKAPVGRGADQTAALWSIKKVTK